MRKLALESVIVTTIICIWAIVTMPVPSAAENDMEREVQMCLSGPAADVCVCCGGCSRQSSFCYSACASAFDMPWESSALQSCRTDCAQYTLYICYPSCETRGYNCLNSLPL